LNLGKSFNSKKIKIASNIPTSSEEFVDMVIIATSDFSVLNDSIKIIRKGGIILIFGEPQMEMKMDLNIDEIYSKEISIITTYAASNKEIIEAIELIDKKIINVKQIVTHKFLIKQSKEAIERIFRKKDTLKTMIINPDK
jgi:L-iditol 2-dehydrogenase